MDWKEFIKPNWKKVLFAILWPIFTLVFGYLLSNFHFSPFSLYLYLALIGPLYYPIACLIFSNYEYRRIVRYVLFVLLLIIVISGFFAPRCNLSSHYPIVQESCTCIGISLPSLTMSTYWTNCFGIVKDKRCYFTWSEDEINILDCNNQKVNDMITDFLRENQGFIQIKTDAIEGTCESCDSKCSGNLKDSLMYQDNCLCSCDNVIA